MKLLLPFLFLLVACNSRQPTRLVGKNGTEMNIGAIQNFASQGYMSAGFDKNGNPRLTVRDNSEAVPIRGLEIGGTVAGGYIMAGVQKAEQAGDAAVALGAQKAGVASQKIAADEAVAIGAQGVQTTAIQAAAGP